MTLSRRHFVNLLGAGAAGSLFAPELGAVLPRRRGRAPLIRLDFNENPNGPGPAALDAIAKAIGGSHRYADDAVAALQHAVARAHEVEPANVAVACGSTDVIRAAVHASASATRPLVTAVPTYDAAAAEATRVGAPVRAVPVGGDLRLDLAAMAEGARGAGLVYLCNPNNPTATVHPREAVHDFVAQVLYHTPDCTVLVDEAYHEYVDDARYESALQLALDNRRVVVARTFSKVHGLAGLRVGYAVGHKDAIARLTPFLLDLGVNGLGAVAAMASLGDRAHVARERARNREGREYLRRFFVDAGFAPVPSDTNFVMVDVRRDVQKFRDACRAEGVVVGRVFPPLATHLRVTVGTTDEMRQATALFRKVLASA